MDEEPTPDVLRGDGGGPWSEVKGTLEEAVEELHLAARLRDRSAETRPDGGHRCARCREEGIG